VNRIAAAAVAAVVALVVAGCSSGSATPEPGSRNAPPKAPGDASTGVPRDADVSHLAAGPLYVALCAPCHGADARGYAADHAPSLVNPTFLESATDDFLRQSIAAGRPGTSMAAYGKARGGPLDAAGVDRLVRYLREQGPAAHPLPATSPGDVAAGAAIYARRCVSCHGDATTRGEAMALSNPGLLAAASDSFLRHAIVRGRPGTKMEAFAGTLTDGEIDAVVSYIRSLGNTAPPVALLPEPTGKEPLVINPSGKAPSFKLRADPCPPALPGTASSCKPDPRFVSVDQVARAVAARQRLVIIDARPTSEWRRVHIAGAVSIPYHELTRLAELPRDGTWIVAYCACPHHLSGIVVDELRKRGFAYAAVLDEGINDWHRRGFPVVAAEGVPRPPADPSGAVLPAGTIR
jgi:mono/diheme cytochrome c family protein/rhodanese-related sulfurtransferase